MDYLKYKTIKFHNEYKNKKKALNDTLNNAYTECSEKTAPTYASEAMRSRSGKTFVNNKYFEYNKSNVNAFDNSDSNRLKDLANQETNVNYNNNNNFSTKNSNSGNYNSNYSNYNYSSNCQNCYGNIREEYNDFNRKIKETQNVRKAANSKTDSRNDISISNNNKFDIARRKIDEYMEEKFCNKNMSRESKNYGFLIY